MPPNHGSSMEMKNKNSSGRLTVIGDDADNGGRSVISASSAKALMLLGETNSKSNS